MFRRILVVFIVGLIIRFFVNYVFSSCVFKEFCIPSLYFILSVFYYYFPKISMSVFDINVLRSVLKIVFEKGLISKGEIVIGDASLSNDKDFSKDGLICKQDRQGESSRGSGSSSEVGSEVGSESMRGSSSRRGSESSTSSGYSIGSETIGGPTNPEFSGSWRYSNEELSRIVYERFLIHGRGVNEIGTGSTDVSTIYRVGSGTIPSARMFISSNGYDYWEYVTPQREYVTQHPQRLPTGSDYVILGFWVKDDINPIWRLRDSSDREYCAILFS